MINLPRKMIAHVRSGQLRNPRIELNNGLQGGHWASIWSRRVPAVGCTARLYWDQPVADLWLIELQGRMARVLLLPAGRLAGWLCR